MNNTIAELQKFLDSSPTAFHTTANIRTRLLAEGFTELLESRPWHLIPGRDYFVCRNGSSLAAFRLNENPKEFGFSVAAAHTDSPTFKLKEHAELSGGVRYTRLNTEGYGNMLCAPWMDRPLSVAGRVLVRGTDGSISSRLTALDRDLVLIPSVAVHLNRGVNEGTSYNKQVDMLPLYGMGAGEGSILEEIAGDLGISPDAILGSDLYLYNRTKASVWGQGEQFLSAARLDDQEGVFAVLQGFLKGRNPDRINAAVFFDNEEVGSRSRQGAASTFLSDVLRRVVLALGGSEEDFLRAAASGFLLNADNAHAVHPNHPEYTDAGNCIYLNGGVTLKFNACQKYSSDGVGAAVVRTLADRAGVPLQVYANRSDKPSGGTLCNIAMTQVSMRSADVGLPQLAMHSCYETGGVEDILSMIRLMETFYSSSVTEREDGSILIR